MVASLCHEAFVSLVLRGSRSTARSKEFLEMDSRLELEGWNIWELERAAYGVATIRVQDKSNRDVDVWL